VRIIGYLKRNTNEPFVPDLLSVVAYHNY